MSTDGVDDGVVGMNGRLQRKMHYEGEIGGCQSKVVVGGEKGILKAREGGE